MATPQITLQPTESLDHGIMTNLITTSIESTKKFIENADLIRKQMEQVKLSFNEKINLYQNKTITINERLKELDEQYKTISDKKEESLIRENALNQNINDISEEINSLKATIDEIITNREEFTYINSCIDNQIDAYEEKVTLLNQEIISLGDDLKNVKANITKIESENAELQKATLELVTEYNQVTTNIEELRRIRLQLEQVFKNLREATELLSQSYDCILISRDEHNKVRDDFNNIEAHKVQKQQNIALLTIIIEDTQIQISRLESDLQTKELTLSDLKTIYTEQKTLLDSSEDTFNKMKITQAEKEKELQSVKDIRDAADFELKFTESLLEINTDTKEDSHIKYENLLTQFKSISTTFDELEDELITGVDLLSKECDDITKIINKYSSEEFEL